MRRVGECCLEFAPSGAYVEDWRMQPGTAGLAASLVLLAEVRSQMPHLCHRGVCPLSAAWAWRLVQDGAPPERVVQLVCCGDHACFTRGRPFAFDIAPCPIPPPTPSSSPPASRGSKTLTRFSAAADDDGAPLEQHVGRCLDRGQRAEAEGLLDLEASYARRAAPGAPFVVEASTCPWLVGEELPDFGPSIRPAFGVGCFGALFLTRGVIRQPARSSRAA